MTKVISLSDKAYNILKKIKADKSFSEIIIEITKEKFNAAMDDDFNIPEAIGFISGFASYLNESILKLNSNQIQQAFVFFEEINKFLGIFPEEEHPLSIPNEVWDLIQAREKLRKEEEEKQI